MIGTQPMRMVDAGNLKRLTGEVVDAAYKVHVGLGPGLLESVYQTILARDLARRGLHVDVEHVFSLEYDGMRFDAGFRIDMLIEIALWSN